MQERRYIVEIGAGAYPFPNMGTRKIQKDEHYMGIDRFDDPIEFMRGKILLLHPTVQSRHNGRLHLIKGDGRMLPYRDESIDEVIFCNVFDEESQFNTLHTDELRGSVLRETMRILKKDGKVIVAQTATPKEAPFHEMKKLLESEGFQWIDESQLSIYITAKVALYNPLGSRDGFPPYVATFVKK